MSSVKTQPTSNSNPSTINGRIDFVSFDSFIAEQLELKQFSAHRIISIKEKPDVIWGLREWIIRHSGYFDIVGYVKYPNLTNWFDYETLIEEFGDLLLLFRDYVQIQKGVDPNCKYKLVRYQNNLSFILHESKPGEAEEFTGLGYSLEDKFNSELWPELRKEFSEFQSTLEKKYGHRLDVEELFEQLCWNGILKQEALKVAKIEE